MTAPSRFLAEVNGEVCSGCGACVDRCFFGAVKIKDDTATAQISAESCMGCGLCMVTCPEEAVSMKEIRALDTIP